MDNNEILFIFAADEAEDLHRSSEEIEQFRRIHEGTKITLVSFHDRFPSSLEQQVHCVKWSELFAYEEMLPIWKAAYDDLNRLVPCMPSRARELVEIYYHEVAFLLWQLKALPAVMARRKGPTCYLVPALWQKLDSPRQLAQLDDEVDTRPGISPWRVALVARSLLGAAWRILSRKVNMLVNARAIVATRRLAARFWAGEGRDFARLLIENPNEFKRRALSWLLYAFNLQFLKKLRENSARAEKVVIPPHASGPVVIMTVEDGGSWVNLRPALHIAEEFKAREEGLIVISSSEWVVREFVNAGHAAIGTRQQSFNLLRFGIEYLRFRGELAMIKTDGVDDDHVAVLCWLNSRGHSLVARKLASTRVLDSVISQSAVASLLTVYEVLPLSVIAGWWARQRAIPWVGFFPILVGDRPDAHHFPAPEHIVYGEQLRTIILSNGYPADSVVVTGSPTYDEFVGRNAATDRQYCLTRFPGIGSRKLVVVATEAFPDPMTEIGPVIDALATIEGIFVVVKVHPADPVEFFERYVETLPGRDLIQVVGACDLGALLHTADLLISIISNIIISAAVLGTPTLVCDFSNKRQVLDFVAAGLCRGCFEPAAVYDMVKRIIFDADEERRTREMLAAGVRQFNGPCDGRSAARIVEHTLRRSREFLAAQAETLGVPVL